MFSSVIICVLSFPSQSLAVLCLFIPVLDFNFVDPTCENGFPLAVMALLPFLLSHYDDPSPLCLRAAQLIAIVRTA